MRPAQLFTIVVILASAVASVEAQSDPSKLTVARIFGEKEFDVDTFGPYEWVDDGDGYTMLEAVEQPESEEDADDDAPPKQLVRFDTGTGEQQVLVTANQLIPEGADKPLKVDAYEWSEDKSKLLLFANTVKVWRDNTRGDYWVLELEPEKLTQIGQETDESTLMFAKFSPSADRVAYVRENNIYVESLATGETTAITTDGSDKVINGTFDWVYEEELGLQDGFRWSPDGKQIAYWQLDAKDIRDFYMINNTDDLYPEIIPLPYPKVGTKNSSCRIGVAPAVGGATTWMKIPGDPQENYLASMEWVADSSELLIEQLNRLQNRRTLWRTSAKTGDATTVFVDENDTWIDMRQKFEWYQSHTHRLILSERDGWRHAYRVRLSDGATELITPGEYDVVDLVGMDSGDDGQTGWLYFTASPHSAIHQYLYRAPLAGGPPERLTPQTATGWHTYDVSPNGKWAVHAFSALGVAPTVELVSLPNHKRVCFLEENTEVHDKLAKLDRGPIDFFQIKIDDPDSDEPLELDGWLIKPPGFDKSKKYPVLIYVYTEPWGQTARDVWGRERYTWHLMLAQRGYIVATVDNRGTPAPKGRDWRKAIYGKIGIVNVRDQAEAAKKIIAWPFIDENRVGVWGWSGGGSMTLNAMFQHPEIYQVGLSVAPVGDQRLYDTIYQERYMGLPEDNEVGFTQGSPVTHAKNLRGKLLLVHGTGDDNVHYQNAEVVINELIEHNRPFDMMSYPNRSHSIKEGDGTQEHLFDLLTRYLTTHLEPGPK